MVEETTHLLAAQEQKEGRVWRRGLETRCSLPQKLSRSLLPLTTRFLFISSTFQHCQWITNPPMDCSISWVRALMMTSRKPQLELVLRTKALQSESLKEMSHSTHIKLQNSCSALGGFSQPLLPFVWRNAQTYFSSQFTHLITYLFHLISQRIWSSKQNINKQSHIEHRKNIN